MAITHPPEYLSFGDALFLYLEREGTPLNIASVAVFEGDISIDELTRFVESKLPDIPRYLQRVVMPSFNVGLPYWEFAPEFSLRNHVREISLKHGTDAELKAAAARVLSPTMDRRNPLWDFTLIHGLKDCKTGLVVRVHHCLADGLSGIGLLNTLMDTTPRVPKLPKKKPRLPSREPKAPGTMLLDSAVQTWFSGVERVLKVANELLRVAQRATAVSTDGTGGNETQPALPLPSSRDMAEVVTKLSSLPERLPFNMLCSGPQNFEWTETSFERLREIKHACGTTVNDVMLSVLTAAFRRYAESEGVSTRGRSLRIVVPVSTRRDHHSGELGNHITFAPVDTPLGIRDPKKLLAEVHERMQFVKTAHVAEFVALTGTLMGTIPSPLQAALAPMISTLPLSLCNTICTNVPGPKFPLYLIGHKMVRAYPYVPIGGEMGLNCAVLTYDGTAYFGFTGDAQAAPDLHKLPAFVDESVEELAAAVGIKRAPTSRKRRAVARRVKRKFDPVSAAKPVQQQATEPPPVAPEGETLKAMGATSAA